MPATGEPELVASVVAPGASVLELGCGAGRVTHPLVALGYSVVAVDESAEMLDRVRGAETVQSSIGELALGRTFDAVLLGSHLVNVPDDRDRAVLLAAARRHVSDDGVVLVEWHPPAWFESVRDGSGGRLGDVGVEIGDIAREGPLLTATVRYSVGSDVWTQTFTARRLTEDRLRDDLSAAGLRFDRYLTDDSGWFCARPR
jgi:SAM-dependent methyltransferase